MVSPQHTRKKDLIISRSGCHRNFAQRKQFSRPNCTTYLLSVLHELHRFSGPYNARQVEAKHQRQLQQRGAKRTLSKPMKKLIEHKVLIDKWSPEEVAHVIGIAFKLIYNLISTLVIYRIVGFVDTGQREERYLCLFIGTISALAPSSRWSILIFDRQANSSFGVAGDNYFAH